MASDKKIFNLVKEIFPICRSLTGDGNRRTLEILQKKLPLKILEVPSGYKAYDWIVPKEWNIKDAYISNLKGKKVVDFQKNNLHVVGYSKPIDQKIQLEELQKHLYSRPDLPSAIPYVTSYYQEDWGFCVEHDKRKRLKDKAYAVRIDSELKKGSLTYGELILKGKSNKEIFISTYICHPSMANNECSGPCVTKFLCDWIKTLDRKYTYRIVFVPETIGAIVYIHKNLKKLKKNVIAAFNITCVGDDNQISFLPSREGHTITDKVARHVLSNYTKKYKEYEFSELGSDERQYCQPKVNLPMVSIMASKYGEYKEYHTSLDNLDFISPKGLNRSFKLIQKCILALENNFHPRSKTVCEPFLSKRNLVPKEWKSRLTNENLKLKKQIKTLKHALIYCDGKNDLIDISNKFKIKFEDCLDCLNILRKENLIK